MSKKRLDAAQAQTKLRQLIEHGRKSAWDPAHDVDWSTGAAELESLPAKDRAALRSLLSLVYFSDAQGQQILTTLCRGLDRTVATHLPLTETAHEFFVHQIDDENRHAAGIKQLFERFAIEPESRTLSHLFYSRLLLADGMFDAKLVLIYWYIEVLAKGVFVELKRRFPNTPIDSLFTRIIRDEARHVGFGEVFIPLHAAEASLGGRAQMATAYYSTAAALPGLFRFTHYARAARALGLDLSSMFSEGMAEIGAKVRRLPRGTGFLDLKRPSNWVAALL